MESRMWRKDAMRTREGEHATRTTHVHRSYIV
jgi:hypothetical protein